MYPRQYDNFTDNFFLRKPCGTTRNLNDQITHTSKYVWIFTDATLASNPYPNFHGALFVRGAGCKAAKSRLATLWAFHALRNL